MGYSLIIQPNTDDLKSLENNSYNTQKTAEVESQFFPHKSISETPESNQRLCMERRRTYKYYECK